MYSSPCATVGKVHHALILGDMHHVCHTRSSPGFSVCKTSSHHFTSRDDCSNQKELIYTYDGLYEVTAADMVTGQEGFKICKSVYQPPQAKTLACNADTTALLPLLSTASSSFCMLLCLFPKNMQNRLIRQNFQPTTGRQLA